MIESLSKLGEAHALEAPALIFRLLTVERAGVTAGEETIGRGIDDDGPVADLGNEESQRPAAQRRPGVEDALKDHRSARLEKLFFELAGRGGAHARNRNRLEWPTCHPALPRMSPSRW